MSRLIWTLLALGGMCIAADLARMSRRCPEPRVEYRFIPRSFEEEQESPVRPSEVFRALFENPDPWVSSGILSRDTRVRAGRYDHNRFWISAS
jgi:hypothetical protein